MVDQKWIDKYPHLYGPTAKDPDEGSDGEVDDFVSRLMNKYTGAGGTFSTWPERHAFITASSIGYLDVATSSDVPPVPVFWVKEAHYWLSGLVMGRASRKIEEAGPSLKTYVAIFAAGGVSIAGILKVFGIAV
jgi:hypothetical protein